MKPTTTIAKSELYRSWRVCLAAPLLLHLASCDRSQPLEPAVQGAFSGAPGPAVVAPSNTNAIAVSASRIDVSWQDNSNKETGFEIYRSTNGPGGTFTLRGSTGADVTTYSDAGAGVDPSTPYCYRVRAFRTAPSGTRYSKFSNTACAPAGDVQVTAVTSGVDLDQDGYTVTLDAANQQGVFPVASANVVTNGTVTISGLRAGDYYRVTLGNMASNCGLNTPNPQAVAVVGGSTAAVGFAVTCALLTPPTAPSLYPPEGYYLGTIWLVWSDNSNNEDGFKVERCQELTCGDADFTLIGTTGANVWWYQDVVGFGIYTYRVRATNRAGDSAPSNQASGRACIEGVDPESPCYP